MGNKSRQREGSGDAVSWVSFVVEEGFVNQELQVAYRSRKARKWIYLGGGRLILAN